MCSGGREGTPASNERPESPMCSFSLVFIVLFEGPKGACNGNACRREVAGMSQGGRKEGARHVLSSILGPWEGTISKIEPLNNERATMEPRNIVHLKMEHETLNF